MASFDKSNGNGNGKGGGKKGQTRDVVKPQAIEIVEPRCKVCNSEYRHQMEALITKGMSYSAVARFFEQLNVDVNRKNLATHMENHAALEKAAIANSIRHRWKEQVVDPDAVEDATQSYMTKYGLLDAMLHKAWERIESDEAEWKPTDVIQIMQYMERLEAQQKNVALDELMTEARCFRDAVKTVVPEAHWEEIVERFEQNLKFATTPILAIEQTSIVGGE
jgi:hypothetical protein